MATPCTSASCRRTAAPVSPCSFPIPVIGMLIPCLVGRMVAARSLGGVGGWVAWIFLFGSFLIFAMLHVNRAVFACLDLLYIIIYVSS